MAAALLLPPPPGRHEQSPASTIGYARTSTLRAVETCTSTRELRQHHSQLVRLGFSDDNDAAGRLIRFLALHPSGDLEYAHNLLRSLTDPDPFVFNTIMRSQSISSFNIYNQMLLRSVVPNRFTFPPLLKSLSSNADLVSGKQIHAHVFKLGFHTDTFSYNSLVNLYLSCGLSENARLLFDRMPRRNIVSWTTLISGFSKIGRVEEARQLFDEMPDRNTVVWNAMISGYVQSRRFVEAFELFASMQAEGIEMNKFAAASMLTACSVVGALKQGRWIHEHISDHDMEDDPKLATNVIDMFCKCGCLEAAKAVFCRLKSRRLSSWNCMIGGLAMHGRGEEAIEMFKEMEKEMVAPDEITLLNVLAACAHAGLVDDGRRLFNHITGFHDVVPKMAHYGCLVDMFGRAGLFNEAKKIIKEMPVAPDAGVLGALLGACKIHNNVELGEEIGHKVIELDPENSGRYVLLANLFANVGRWDDVAKVRTLMNDRDVNKEAGCSIIEMKGELIPFVAGGSLHPQSSDVYNMHNEMHSLIRSEGYTPEEGEGEKNYHSEKLAIAFGLLNSGPGETIRVTKNLRVCRDCHEASKFISKVYDREIVVRDRNRFHHFRGGECSCKDYW